MPADGEQSPLVRLRAIERRFHEGDRVRTVLAGIDADIRAGEFVVLLGRSGSGKSTLLNLIAGMDVPDAGTVVVGDDDVTQMTERERTLFRRRHVGFVFQFFNLIPTLTVEENVGLHLDLCGRLDEAGRRRVLELLERVGLADRQASAPDRLSGGEQQRVAIAAALAHEPLLVLADEPTGNLDAETGAKVLQLLYDLVHGQGRTLIMATHAADVADRADRVLELQSGRVVERGRE